MVLSTEEDVREYLESHTHPYRDAWKSSHDHGDFDRIREQLHESSGIRTTRISDYPFASVAALGGATFGITTQAEYYYAFAAQIVYWIAGYTDLDGVTNAITGVQFGKGKYKHAMFAAILDLYESFQDYNKMKTIGYHNATRLIIFFIGYLLGWMKVF